MKNMKTNKSMKVKSFGKGWYGESMEHGFAAKGIKLDRHKRINPAFSDDTGRAEELYRKMRKRGVGMSPDVEDKLSEDQHEEIGEALESFSPEKDVAKLKNKYKGNKLMTKAINQEIEAYFPRVTK